MLRFMISSVGELRGPPMIIAINVLPKEMSARYRKAALALLAKCLPVRSTPDIRRRAPRLLLHLRLGNDAPFPRGISWSVVDRLCPPEEKRLMARSPRRPSPVASPLKLIAPSLATLVDQPPSGVRWLHEIKWDGYRLIACVAQGEVVLRTRRGLDWTARFPTIAAAIARLPIAAAVLDGEAVVENERGLPDFSALQAALGVRNARGHPGYKTAPEAVYYAFDLLWLDGEDLRERALEERRSALEKRS